MSEKIFNDPIHNHIKLPPLCVKIIDTPQFQRLRSIKQLGGTYFVFPGAAHNRFEHSLGVCYLAGKLASTLKERQHDLNITKNDVLCVQIAGLCHDLGQGPFSRMFENKFLPMFNDHKQITHESLSLLMFDHLLEKNNLKEEFTKCGLKDEDILFIREQIQGCQKTEEVEWPYQGRTKEKGFLYEIVANRRNGIDVDKWDYFDRDCCMLGIKNNFDHKRCMENVRVIQSDTFEPQLCFAEKEVGNLCAMFKTRFDLHSIAYKHRVGDIIETMIADAMFNANDIIKISGKDGKKLDISKTIEDMEAYEKLTDSILEKILQSNKDGLERSKEILRRVQKRNLYKVVGVMDPKQSTKTDSELKKYIKEEEESFLQRLQIMDSKWKREDFIIHCVSLDYGMKDENPLNHVCFYNKKGIPFRYTKKEVSSRLPYESSKKELRFICKREDETSIEQAKKAIEMMQLQ